MGPVALMCLTASRSMRRRGKVGREHALAEQREIGVPPRARDWEHGPADCLGAPRMGGAFSCLLELWLTFMWMVFLSSLPSARATHTFM